MAAPKKTQKRMPRRREEFTYRGYKIDELKAMGLNELLPLMPARARRKVVRGFSRGDETLLTKVREGASVANERTMLTTRTSLRVRWLAAFAMAQPAA